MRSRCRGRRAPDALLQLVAGQHAARLAGQREQQPELGRRQRRRRPSPRASRLAGAEERAPLVGLDPQALDLDRRAALVGDAAAAAQRRLHARHQLAHAERLRQVVVGADAERVHLVVLGPAGRHGDDRRADALAARRLGHRPAVEAGQHHVDHGDVGALVAQLREAALAVLDPLDVEARMAQVLEHHAGHDGVVLDHEHACHAVKVPGRGARKWETRRTPAGKEPVRPRSTGSARPYPAWHDRRRSLIALTRRRDRRWRWSRSRRERRAQRAARAGARRRACRATELESTLASLEALLEAAPTPVDPVRPRRPRPSLERAPRWRRSPTARCPRRSARWSRRCCGGAAVVDREITVEEPVRRRWEVHLRAQADGRARRAGRRDRRRATSARRGACSRPRSRTSCARRWRASSASRRRSSCRRPTPSARRSSRRSRSRSTRCAA